MCAESFIAFLYYPFDVCRICSDIPYVALLLVMSSLFFSLSVCYKLSVLLIFSKNQMLVSLIFFFYYLPASNVIEFCFYIYYFLSSACFWHILFIFSKSEMGAQIIDLTIFFILRYAFSSINFYLWTTAPVTHKF